MTNLRKYLLLIFFVGVLATSAGAQVRFDVYSNPYSGRPGVAVSVGNSGYCQQPVYNNGYVVYPANGGYVNRGVVVAPYYNNGYYNQGNYNNGYYSNGNCNNNGYYVNNGGYYNTGYANPGYGYNNRGYSNRGYQTRYNSRSRRCR